MTSDDTFAGIRHIHNTRASDLLRLEALIDCESEYERKSFSETSAHFIERKDAMVRCDDMLFCFGVACRSRLDFKS